MPRHAGNYAGRSSPAFIKARDQVYREETHCWLCGGWVDQSLDRRHPMARTADHLVQLCHSGPEHDRGNLRLAHGHCNTARSNAMRGLRVEDCACSVGLPCQRVRREARRGYVSLDLSTI